MSTRPNRISEIGALSNDIRLGYDVEPLPHTNVAKSTPKFSGFWIWIKGVHNHGP